MGEVHPTSTGMWFGRTPGCRAVCDGAIYNWRSLDPEALDVDQALQNLYERQGPAFVNDLDGSFALAIADECGIFVARDTLGISPLYCGDYDGAICFASEVKSLVGWARDIREFPPGHFYHPRTGTKRYGEFTMRQPADMHVADAASELRCRLVNAVAKCVCFNGEVGCWLSGGIDSSALAALASLQMSRVKTFSVGAVGAPDLEHARTVANAIDSEHHEITMNEEQMLQVLPEVIYHLESFDALLVRSSVTNYLVGRLASEHVNAVLSGEGADELFAGYSYLKTLDRASLAAELVDLTNRLHNTALQRVDRCSSAHGLFAHTPFLDSNVREFAATVPLDLKLYRDGEVGEKWILRRALDAILPESVVNRPKAKFWEGAGVAESIKEYASRAISDSEFASERLLPDGSLLNSKEEFFYYRIFRDQFGLLDDLSFVGRTKCAS